MNPAQIQAKAIDDANKAKIYDRDRTARLDELVTRKRRDPGWFATLDGPSRKAITNWEVFRRDGGKTPHERTTT